jgi:hypothetical protein
VKAFAEFYAALDATTKTNLGDSDLLLRLPPIVSTKYCAR